MLEGGEGSGKSTQAERLQERLSQEGNRPSVLLREPGTTPLGLHLRDYLKSKRPLCLEAETLMFAAARAQLMCSEILPNLKAGRGVVCDRFAASTVAYQGEGRNGDHAMIRTLNKYATGGLKPDLTLLLDITPEKGLARVGKPQLELGMSDEEPAPRLDVEGHRRFEDLTIAFHRRVRRSYLHQAKQNPRWTVIDADQSEDQVAEDVWQAAQHIVR